MATEREDFEAWYRKHAFQAGDRRGWEGVGWAAWQARAALASASVVKTNFCAPDRERAAMAKTMTAAQVAKLLRQEAVCLSRMNVWQLDRAAELLEAQPAPLAGAAEPIAYPDEDLSAGLSTNGVVVCGSPESIKQVQQWLHSHTAVAPCLRAEITDARAELKRAAHPAEQPTSEDGYETAFYELASLMGFTAQPVSPERAWRDQMLPRLRVLLEQSSPDTNPVRGRTEMAELDPRTAADHARAMLFYVQNASAGQKFDPIFDDPERRNWAAALDNLEETAAMLLNMSERATEQPSQDAERLWDAFIAEIEKKLGFKVVNLMGSVEKLREMYLAAARAAQAQGESTGGTPHG